MTEETTNRKMPLREATDGDIPVMARHHRNMCEEIWKKKGEDIDHSKCNEIEKAYSDKLRCQLNDGTCKAWIIEHKGDIVSSGAVSIVSFVPTPQDLSCSIAYLHSMYTVKDHRYKHCATRIIRRTIDYCRERGIKRVILNASEAGQPVYERAGFRPAVDVMRLLLEA